MGCLRHLYNEAQRKYNNPAANIVIVPQSPFSIFKFPASEPTRKRALTKE